MSKTEIEPEKPKVAWGGAGVSPWGAVPTSDIAPVSLADVMSEELADQLQKKEFHFSEDTASQSHNRGAEAAADIPADNEFDTSDDLLIAQMSRNSLTRSTI